MPLAPLVVVRWMDDPGLAEIVLAVATILVGLLAYVLLCRLLRLRMVRRYRQSPAGSAPIDLALDENSMRIGQPGLHSNYA